MNDATAIIGPDGSPLAVKMTNFSVSKESSNTALLRWTTATESANDKYVVEYSLDGINYQELGSVKGAGTTNNTSNYQFTAALPSGQPSVVYYRLLVVGIDGNVTTSPINTLHLDNLAVIEGVKVAPNPFINSVQVTINSAKTENSTIRIINLAGQELVRRSVTLNAGSNVIELKDLNGLSAGLHTIEIITDKGVVSQKLIKK